MQVFPGNLGAFLSKSLHAFRSENPEPAFNGSISLSGKTLLFLCRQGSPGSGGRPMKKAVRELVLIQPPFAQLNSPYPAPYYLKSFLEKTGRPVTVLDHSIALFERIFSRTGLERIFADAPRLAGQPGSNSKTDRIAERFLSEKTIWLAAIERLTGFLRGRDPEFGHFLALANGCLPGGPRTDAYLSERDGEISVDDAALFATMLLSDLADFITCTLDRSFSLVRYAPVMEASLNAGFRDFAAVQKNLDGYIMNTFYRPLLIEEWKAPGNKTGFSGDPFLLGLTIPFSGCLAGALVCADSAKKQFGSSVRTVAGGGFVNTELRFLNTPDFFYYFDYLAFDRGYGSLVSILDHIEAGEQPAAGGGLYKTMYRAGKNVVASPDIASVAHNAPSPLEDEAVKTNFPDYSAVDFSRYICPVDDANPMHRLWSGGHWLKAYLAHGCYWHSCAFCDVGLDYIKNFIPVDTAALFAHLKCQAEKTGVRGIHFCDEAAPVSSLLEFALLNRNAGLPLNFWGNIRFEKDFTPDTAAILAAGGLLGVSAGLEVATERGFKATGKGIDLGSAAATLAAFKEAGILTHAYLIYGYWDEDEQELIDSAEIVRQLFSHGLLDSAFWHKFILTRHSRIYAEKQRGLHSELKVEEPYCGAKNAGIFALNDISFESEEKSDKYTQPLDTLLGSWMAGETDMPVSAAFPFKVKTPRVSPDLAASLLDKYAGNRDRNRKVFPVAAKNDEAGNNVIFLGSIPRIRQKGKNVFVFWYWRFAERELKVNGINEAEKLVALLKTASEGKGIKMAEFYVSLEKIFGKTEAPGIWRYLRRTGINCYFTIE